MPGRRKDQCKGPGWEAAWDIWGLAADQGRLNGVVRVGIREVVGPYRALSKIWVLFWVKENPTEDLEHLPCVSKGSVAVLLKLGWRQRDLFEGYCKRDLDGKNKSGSNRNGELIGFLIYLEGWVRGSANWKWSRREVLKNYKVCVVSI